MLKRFVGLNFCRTQNWSGRSWRSSCHTPLLAIESGCVEKVLQSQNTSVQKGKDEGIKSARACARPRLSDVLFLPHS